MARPARFLALGLLILTAGHRIVSAAPVEVSASSTPDVTEIDIDDLLNVRVTSPQRKEQPLADVPSATYVIRQEDLRRMGVTSLAEALRAAPGMDVARVGASTWAISARGFNDVFSNELLVLIDGRSVYSPLHSGVYWDVQDTLLEDVERIEVVRGPGGTLWGANAVDGVVNVITKSAAETQGGTATGALGTEEKAQASVRYGFRAGENAHLRVWAKYFDRDDARDGIDPAQEDHDAWSMAREGFRADWGPAESHTTLMGEYYGGSENARRIAPLLTAPFAVAFDEDVVVKGGNLIARTERRTGPSSSMSLQAYYDYTSRSEALLRDTLRTGDLDFQHRFRPFEGHDLIWGLGYRIYRSATEGTLTASVDPASRTDDLWSGFIQDEMTFAHDRLRLTVGTKLEDNDYTGLELQPGMRLLYRPHERHVLWTSVSRAVRTPSIIDVDGRLTAAVFPTNPPVVAAILGSDAFRSEALVAYEAGYRVRAARALHLDATLFHNDYDHLRSGEIGTAFVESQPPPLHIVVPILLANELHGRTSGLELAANFQAAPGWLLQGNWSALEMHMSAADVNERSPRRQLWIRSAADLPGNLSLDVIGRYVSSLPTFDVDAYTEADLRLAWRSPSGAYEAALSGQNLLHGSHAEFEVPARRREIERGAYASLTRRF